MRYVGRWPLLPIAGRSGDDELPPPLTPALAREPEKLFLRAAQAAAYQQRYAAGLQTRQRTPRAAGRAVPRNSP
jgi:hypothetical protein